jgi:hypothetical protein
MSDTEFNRIMEAVTQGIVASKQSDSKFWGEWQNWRKIKDEKDNQMHDSLIEITQELKGLKEAKIAQNGRLATCETSIMGIGKEMISFQGGLKLFFIILPLILGLISTIFWLRTDTLASDIIKLETNIIK